MEPLTVNAYDTVTGAYITRIPVSECDWSDERNGKGSLNVTVPLTDQTARKSVWAKVKPWKATLAVLQGETVRYAGPVVSRHYTIGGESASDELKYTCGSMMTLLGKRLAIDPANRAGWVDRQIVIDDQHPAAGMSVEYSATGPNVLYRLVQIALQWGPLPVDSPAPVAGGSVSIKYLITDLKTISDAMGDITQRGYETRFDPYIADNTLRYRFKASGTLAEHSWAFNPLAPEQRVIITDVDDDGQEMIGQEWEVGGSNDDKAFMARADSSALTDDGYPLLQGGDLSHSTEASLGSLQGYARRTVSAGSHGQDTYQLRIGCEHNVLAGDSIGLHTDDPVLGRTQLTLRVESVKGSFSDEFLTVEVK
ncbi:hypothetical protein OZX57_06535 [Bifidobacterium sp. ESL0682]|uniref:hypothetical protein n=1 Tax=Bifidobacterium sp. ESL0682 TaxID=2983212 RepID=UPI0023F8929B|nr:hypothetical protein [Bifidobacterium sp. ESL0682]WEV41643.1 hypothetical protein OZX57_06535 [Bifidobacterium sp. ESL0682]